MKKNNTFGLNGLLALAIFLLSAKPSISQTTLTYSFTGSVQTFIVPSCVLTVTINARGAQGGLSGDQATIGGLGGLAVGVLSVTAGNVLNIYVGGSNGYNGGGGAGVNGGCSNANGGSGGGASDVRLNGVALTDRVIVGAGGGGAGGNRINACGRGAGGGGGGGYYGGGGGSGYPSSSVVLPLGGSQTLGGTGGTSAFSTTQNGLPGSLGFGGAGGIESGSNQGGANSGLQGGAGGGLTGSPGQQPPTNIFTGQSGAGGSSFTGTLTNASTTPSFQTGNGLVTISYVIGGGIVSAVASNTLICAGSSVNITASGAVTNYTWNTGSNSSSITVSPTTNTVYSVSSTNSVNCISVSNVSITVNNGLPSLSINTSTNSTCLGKTVTLTATGANTYSWTNGVSNGVSYTPTGTNSYVVTGQNACGTSTAVTTVSILPLPVTIVSNPTTICAGSTSTIIATAAANSYSWFPVSANSPSIIVSPQVSTIYTVAVSDGTCAGLATVAVNALPVPTISALPVNTIVCSGELVTFTASGGISYTWSVGNQTGSTFTVAPNAPTGYQVVGSNSLGCTSAFNVAVITDPSPTITLLANSNLVCAGDQVDITASGANSYLWSNSSTSSSITVNPMVTTVYSVTGTTNSCSTTETVSISVFVPTLSIAGNTSICIGETTTLTASSANSYAWNNGFNSAAIQVNPNTSSIYSVTALTSSGSIVCSSSNSIQVLVKPNPTLTIGATKSVMCRNENNIITVSGANSYTWDTGANSASISITPSLVTTLNYSVIGTSSLNCTASNSLAIKVNPCTGINESKFNKNNLFVYPNPNQGEFKIKANQAIALRLMNELGQVLKYINLNESNHFEYTMSGMSHGIYFITSTDADVQVKQKIIVAD